MDMVLLNPEEERVLRELIDARESGKNIDEFTQDRLYAYDSDLAKRLRDARARNTQDDFYEVATTYHSLAEKGMVIEASTRETCIIRELTTEGRNYFKTKRRCEEEANKKKWSERRFTIIWGIITMLASCALGFLGGSIS